MADPLIGAPGAPTIPPATPPAGGVSPGVSIPQAGLEALALKDVKDALSKLKGALPRLASGSDTEKAVLKALQALTPVVGVEAPKEPPAGPRPGGLPMGGPVARPLMSGPLPGLFPGPTG